jgi:hypothetical protein
MTERTTIRLPDDLISRAKSKAAAEGRTLTALIEEGLRRVVNERAPAKAKRILPRVSTATGGLLPGMNLDDKAQLQDIEDREYVSRFK